MVALRQDFFENFACTTDAGRQNHYSTARAAIDPAHQNTIQLLALP
jgi:hypothetical protein